jgi:ubiquinone/menaquinone biosynthesis C-methylase UbiE
MTPPPDWRLPPGVSRDLWDYLHDRDLARGYDARLAGTPLLEQDLRFAAQHFPTPGRLIDLGCGTGRLLVPFGQRGYSVVGVDLSAEMLAVAAEKAAAAGVTAELLRANLVELDGLRDATFEYAACLFSTLGMIAGAANRRRALGHMHRLLKPGGVLVLHVHNRNFNLWDPSGRRWLFADIIRALRGHTAAGDRAMPPHQGIGGFTLHLFMRQEIVRELRAVDFELTEVRAVSLRVDGVLPHPWWFGSLRAYGYLIAARRLAGP